MIAEVTCSIMNRFGRENHLTFTPSVTTATSDTVILLHGFKGFRNWAFWPPAAQALAQAGFHVVRVDFSLNGMQGTSDRVVSLEDFAQNTLSREVDEAHDVLAALAYHEVFAPWRSRMTGKVHLIGHSRGGGIAQVVGRELVERAENIGAVIGWNSVGKWGRHSERQRTHWIEQGYLEVEHSRTGQTLRMNASYLEDLESNEERLRLITACEVLGSRMLFIHAETDMTVNIAEVRRLIKDSNGRASLIEVEGSTHTFGITHPLESITGSLVKVVKHTIRHLQS